MEIIRRLGSTPHERGSLNNGTCPDCFEVGGYDSDLADHDVRILAIIGTDMTDELRDQLPAGTTVLPHDRIVVVDSRTLHDAQQQGRRDSVGHPE